MEAYSTGPMPELVADSDDKNLLISLSGDPLIQCKYVYAWICTILT